MRHGSVPREGRLYRATPASRDGLCNKILAGDIAGRATRAQPLPVEPSGKAPKLRFEKGGKREKGHVAN